MAGKTKNVGNIESKLLLDTKDFEQGVTRTEKRLLKLTGDFIKTQQNINGSLRNLNATFKENTDEISKRVGKVKDAVNGLNEANKGYSKNIVVAISSMEKSVVAELSKISQAFKELKVVSNENFDKGIKTLDRSVKQSSNNIKVSLDNIKKQADSTTKSLEVLSGKAVIKVGTKKLPQGTTGRVAQSYKYAQSMGNVGNTFSSMTSDADGFLGAMTKASFKIFLVRKALEQVGEAMDMLVGKGVQFASSMETLRLGYAGIITSTLQQNGEDIPYNKALLMSEALLQRMQDEALKTSLTMEELGNALQSTMALGINAGMNLEQVLDLTVVGAQAVKTFGLSNQQVVQELRGLISGEAIRPGVDMLATILGYTTQTVNQLRAEGKLYEDIMQRMEGFKYASDEFQNTLTGLVSNMQDGISRVMGTAVKTSGLFETIKGTLQDMQSIFFTIEKSQQKLDDGRVVTVNKVKVNPETVKALESLYTSLRRIWEVLAPVGQLLANLGKLLGGTILVLLEKFADILTIIISAFTPLLTVVNAFIEGLVDLLTPFDELNTNVGYSKKAIEELATTLETIGTVIAVLTGVVFAFTNPWLAVVAAIAGIAIAFKKLKPSIDNFFKYLGLKIGQAYNNFLALGAAIKDIFTLNFSANSDKPYAEEAKKYAEEAEQAWSDASVNIGDEIHKSIVKSLTKSIGVVENSVADFKRKQEKGNVDLTSGITSKYEVGKENTSKNSKQAKSAYKALESAFKQLENLVKEQQAKLDSYFKNDLISTQDYIDNKYTLQKLLLEDEIKNLEERKKVAEKLGQLSDVDNFNSKITTARDSLANLEAKMIRESIEEYKKLESRLDSIKSKYQGMVGVTQKAFEYNLAKEFSGDIVRIYAEMKSAEERLKNAEKDNNESEKAIWTERLARYKETQRQLSKIIELKGLEREAENAKAEIERIDLDIQAKYIEKKDQVNRLAQTQAELEGDLFDFRKEHMDEYIDQYTTLIAYYEAMASKAEDLATKNSYKKMALDARDAMYQLVDAVPPFQKAMKEQFIGSLSDAFQSMLWQEKTAKEAFEDFAKSILQTWSKKVFDEVATAMTDGLFQGLLPKGEKTADIKVKAQQIIDTKVQVNMEEFKNRITNSAIDIQQSLTNDLIPAIRATAQEMQNLIAYIANLTGTPKGTIPQEGIGTLSSLELPKESPQLQGVNFGLEGVEDKLADSFSVITVESGGLKNSLADLSSSVGLNISATEATTAASKQAGDFAIPMMITSLLSASGVLGKFGVVVQGVMMAMQIAKTAGILGFAEGGYVSGAGTATSDSISARLSNGEYVLKASSVKALGTDFLDTLNNIGGYSRSSKLPKFAFADGGYVNATQNAPQEGIENIPKTIQSSPQVVMNMTFQSLDPESNMKMMEAQYPSIRNRLIRDLQSNSSMRTAVKGASR